MIGGKICTPLLRRFDRVLLRSGRENAGAVVVAVSAVVVVVVVLLLGDVL